MEQNKLPKNIWELIAAGEVVEEKEDWIRVYMEDYVHTYIQRLRGLEEGGVSGGMLLGKKQRINGIMHLFIYDILGLSWDNSYPNHCNF